LDLTKKDLEKHLKRKMLKRQVLKQRFQQILGSKSKLPAQMGVDTTSQLVSQVNNFRVKPLSKQAKPYQQPKPTLSAAKITIPVLPSKTLTFQLPKL
jgi:hypothetical protein